jgi:hypothetical protein
MVFIGPLQAVYWLHFKSFANNGLPNQACGTILLNSVSNLFEGFLKREKAGQ